nr:hypothetical protein [Nonomuraea sediminis]
MTCPHISTVREVCLGSRLSRHTVTCTRDLAEGLRESGWLDGCPVTTTALESADRVPEIQQATEDAYEN